ncbi:MAG: dockerin type I repeat-containing protein, partial [Clostridia bacterium]|nr:dockerin type I repeat-containing protein [Clostridia bacterium]
RQYYPDPCRDDQSPDNLWGLGKHTVTASLMGAETTFTVEIVKSPIERITAKDVTVIKDLDVLFNGEFNQYHYNPEVTVYFNDGTSQTAIGGVTYGDSTFMFSYKDNQSKFKKWGVGAHKATVSVSGVSCDFTVNVIENPIASVNIPAVTVVEGMDGHFEPVYDDYGEIAGETFIYFTEPEEFTVNFKDGTSQKSDNGVITYNGNEYYMSLEEVDDQHEKEWKAGETHKVNAKIMGFTQTYTVNVAENPYSAMTISGKHEFVITFDRKDGGTETYTATDFWGIMGNTGKGEGYLFTDAGKEFVVNLTCDTENGENLLDSNLVLQIGKMTSAPLNGNKWIKVCIDTYSYYTSISYIKPEIEDLFNKAFNGYNGKITAENLDQLLIIAAHIGRWTGEDVESETGPDGLTYIVAEEKAVHELLYSVFGESGVDVTASSFYSADGKLRIPYLGFSLEMYEKTMVYKDGQYIITYPVSEDEFLTIAMDENAHITWIVFGDENPPTKLGDINGDGKINAVDSNLIKKIVLGTFEFSIAADMDGNGKLNSVDSYLLKHKILGG